MMMTFVYFIFLLNFLFVPRLLAFTVNSNSVHETRILQSNLQSKYSTRLDAVAIPAEQEDEKKKKKKSLNDEESNDSNDWTTTKGGFIPNILKRTSRPKPKVHLVDNIHDYKNVVVDENEQIVVVRFFANWCRSCKATKPSFNKLVNTFSDSSVKFVEVPLTKETAYLQEGLGVPSVPFAHIYHPYAGLVEEMKMSKPHLQDFSDRLKSYVVGSCDIPGDENNNLDEDYGVFE
mmetsp:Transcript_27926/g.34470  ORF Transcript_27926/g.34470 Transcript_27926/m.34470 type:complete len:233 (-) Transcript_27926:102-800(-)